MHPSIFLNSTIDALMVLWNDNAYFEKRINKYLTLFIQDEDKETVTGLLMTNFSSFSKSGIRIDELYDECPNLTEGETERVDQILEGLLLSDSTKHF